MATPNIQDLGNGQGYIYETLSDGTTVISSLPNNQDGYYQVRKDATIGAALTGEILPHAEIVISAVTSTNNITAVNINGVNQIGGNVAMLNGDQAGTAAAVVTAINSYTAVSGAEWTAISSGGTIYLKAPAGSGTSLNGQTVAIVSGSGLTYTATSVYGGTDANQSFDQAFGKRYFLNANYGGAASQGSLTNAIEITKYLVLRGLQSKIDTPAYTLSSDTLTADRTMSILSLTVDTEGGGGTDNLYKIVEAGFVFGDVLIIRGANASRVVTVKNTTGTGQNIYLQNSTDCVLGDVNHNIVLQYVNDNGTAKWVELGRTPSLVSVSVAALRAANIPTPVNGTHVQAMTNGGGTVNFVPGTDKGYQIITGNPTLSGSWTYGASGSPIDGDRFYVDYRATATTGVNTVTIFGLTLTTNQALAGNTLIIATYDAANSTWRAQQIQGFSSTGFIENGMILNSTITGAKIASGTIDASKLSFSVPTSVAYDTWTVPISFESGEQAIVTMLTNYAGTVTNIRYTVTKALAGTDAGTIQVTTSSGGLLPVISIPASTAQNTFNDITPTSANTFTSGSAFQITVLKPTAGGKALLTFSVTRS